MSDVTAALMDVILPCVCVLLLAQFLDEHRDGGWVRSHFLDEGVVVLALRLQTHLKQVSFLMSQTWWLGGGAKNKMPPIL